MSSISQNDLARYIVTELKAGKNVNALSKKVAEYLVSQRRSRELAAVMRKVAKLRQQQHGVIEATVTSTHPLSSSTLARVKALMGESGKVILSQNIDPSVIGGLKVEGADRGIDLTVQKQLIQLKQLTGVNQ